MRKFRRAGRFDAPPTHSFWCFNVSRNSKCPRSAGDEDGLLKKSVVAVGVASLLFTVGCSSDGQTTAELDRPTQPAATSEPSNSPTATANTGESPRGNKVKAFDERAGLGCESGGGFPCEVEFVIGAPVPASECSTTQYQPEFGSILAFPIRVEILPGVNVAQYTAMFTPDSFSAVLESGVTTPEITSPAAWVCAESNNSIPSQLSPASTYEGFMVLDVPTDSTTIVFQPGVMEPGQGWWEWPL